MRLRVEHLDFITVNPVLRLQLLQRELFHHTWEECPPILAKDIEMFIFLKLFIQLSLKKLDSSDSSLSATPYKPLNLDGEGRGFIHFSHFYKQM